MWPAWRLYPSAYASDSPPNPTEPMAREAALSLGLIGTAALLVYIVWRSEGPRTLGILGFRAVRPLRALVMGTILLGVLLLWKIVTQFAWSGWEEVVELPLDSWLRPMPEGNVSSVLSTTVDLLTAGVAELFFRAYLMATLTSLCPRTWMAAPLASLLWVPVTSSPSSLIYFFGVGLVLCMSFRCGWPLWLLVLCNFLAWIG